MRGGGGGLRFGARLLSYARAFLRHERPLLRRTRTRRFSADRGGGGGGGCDGLHGKVD